MREMMELYFVDGEFFDFTAVQLKITSSWAEDGNARPFLDI